MTSPTPTHHPGTLQPRGKKKVSKSAAKRQRAKQQREADVATAATAAAVEAAATAVEVSQPQQAGFRASATEQVGPDTHRGGADPRHQQTAADLYDVEDTASSPRPTSLIAKRSAEASADELTAAGGDSQSYSRADAQASPKTAEPTNDLVTHSEQANTSHHTNGRLGDLQATNATPNVSSSSDSSSGDLASRPAAGTLLSKPDRPQPSEPTPETLTNSVSANASASHPQSNPAELHYHPDSLPSSNSYPSSSRQDQSHSHGVGDGGVNLGSGGDKGGGPRGPQAEGILAKRPVAPVGGSDGKRGPARLLGSLKLSKRAVCFPSIGATAALVHAFAIADDIEQCFR